MARVMLATDGSALAIAAARRALDILGPDQEYLVVTVAAEPDPTGVASLAAGSGAGLALPDPETWDRLAEKARAAARDELDRTVGALGITAQARLLQGDPADALCQEAAAAQVDLIVVGSHGSGVLRRALLGSVSHAVLHHAPCPVLVVREAAAP